MIQLIKMGWPPPADRALIMFAIIIGTVVGMDLAAWIGKTPIGALVMGMIVGSLAMVRAIII